MLPEWNGALFRVFLDSSLRVSLVAVAIACMLCVLRVRSSGLRHAAWTAVLLTMLLMPVLPYCLPSIPMPTSQTTRISGVETPFSPETLLAPRRAEDGVAAVASRPAPGSAVQVPKANFVSAPAVSEAMKPSIGPMLLWISYALGTAILLVRLLFGWHQMRQISKLAIPIELSGVGAPVLESSLIATPLTVGVLTPKVLLPPSWRLWPDEKLRAVLAHEVAHVQRHDPLVALLAHLNRCLFWFHPLAWWLERKLATTAEHACDDAAIRTVGEGRRYAAVLLDMAEAVRRRGSRFSWQGIGVRGTGFLGERIDRVLRRDLLLEPSRLHKGIVAFGCAAAIFIIAACRQAAPPPQPLQQDPKYAQLQADQKARSDFYKAAHDMNAQQVADLEASLKKNPEDMEALKKLLQFYAPLSEKVPGRENEWAPICSQVIGEKQCIAARRAHILWLIEHHPDHELAGDWGARIYPTSLDPLPDPLGYEQAKKLWLAKASNPDARLQIFKNASYFFEVPDKALAEKMMLRAQALDPKGHWSGSLGRLYAFILVGSNSSTPLNVVRTVSMADAHSPYAQEIRKKLDSSTDVELLSAAAEYLEWTRGLYDKKLDFDPVALSKSYLERVLQLDLNAEVARARLGRQRIVDRNIRLNQILKGVDKASEYQTISALPEAERFEFLPELAQDAYMNGEYLDASKHDQAGAKVAWENARKYASDALQLGPKYKDHANYGVAVYMGNMVLGALTFRNGDRNAAVNYMLAASQAPAAQDLDYYVHFHMKLTKYLLKYGERESVIQFLERIAQVSTINKKSLLEAANQIRNGIQPVWYPKDSTGLAGR
jgi:hypothetical protein